MHDHSAFFGAQDKIECLRQLLFTKCKATLQNKRTNRLSALVWLNVTHLPLLANHQWKLIARRGVGY